MYRDVLRLDTTQTDLVDRDSRPDPDPDRGPNRLVVQEVLEDLPVPPLGSWSIRP